MKRIEKSALVPFSAERMFDLVNDVPAYPQFMSGCVGATVLEHQDSLMVARLELASAGFRQSFVTRNTLTRPDSIALSLEDGPFSHLKGCWNFKALSEDACKIEFWLEFNFSNRLLGLAVGKLFEKIASDQVDAFCRRAKDIYA